VDRVRALIAAGDEDSLMLAREMLGEIESDSVRAALASAMEQIEALRQISDIL
jgi:HEAT repeat protein